MSRALFSGALAAVVTVAAIATPRSPAKATIASDPKALYATMRAAYDVGVAHGWPFVDELAYGGAIFDAGRAYALVRPTDPNYREVATLTVDVATQLRYDPLLDDNAALWYVRAATAYVAQNGDAAHGAEARALLDRLGAEEADRGVLARDAVADAVAIAARFPRDRRAAAEILIAGVRAYDLTGEATFASDLLGHASAPDAPVAAMPEPEFERLAELAGSMSRDSEVPVADRRAAASVVATFARASHVRSQRTIPRELVLVQTAPADEYFGDVSYSPLVVRNELVRIGRYLDVGWGDRMESDIAQVDTALEDWQKHYPHDATLPATLLDAYLVFDRVSTATTRAAAARVATILAVEYPGSRQAREIDPA